ncbi:hypothetical protein AWE51_05610 [Aquimarina aggregata]|uniref:Type I restriction modification DNA specificity domain-containing protein n=1 Tax=Aquimarina aggregata TaxID=1642818 RepID=A0A163ABW6_9FLAO|nr:restriction endonuclease subunit S [Aquimarina aggregata]KZS40427.1 hypothetical protein AWE51_05610 [Aquimarina aggregata]
MSREKVKISSFLAEREVRYKPDIANKLGLKRVKKIDFTGNIHLVESKPTRTNMILVKKGDLLISGINAEKGGVAIYEYSEDAIATIHYSSYTYDESKIDIDYLKWFLKSNEFKQTLIDQAGSGIKSELKPKRFLSLEVSLPTLNEQKEILKNLNSINSEAEELKSLIVENEVFLSKLRQSILQDAIKGKLTQKWREENPDVESSSELLRKIKTEKEQLIKEKKIRKEKKFEKISNEEIEFDIPASWTYSRIVDLSKVVTDGDHSTPERTHEGYYLLSARNVTNKGISLQKVDYVSESEFIRMRKRCAPQKGDILISCSGSVGRVAIVDKDDTYVMVRSAAMVKHFHEYLDSEYLAFSLKSPYLQTQIVKKTKTTAQSNLFLGRIKELVVPLPSLEEQIAIKEKVKQLFTYCNEFEQEIKISKNNAEKLMQSILSELLGQENNVLVNKSASRNQERKLSREIKYNSKTLLMDLVEILKENGKLHAEDLWKMSKHPNDIDAFYAELKKQIEEEKAIKEVVNEKGYLELA